MTGSTGRVAKLHGHRAQFMARRLRSLRPGTHVGKMEWNFRSGSVAAARESRREFVSELRAQANAQSDLPAAELIFGELIGNVVKHAPGRVSVKLEWNGPKAILSVCDIHAPFKPKFTLPADIMSESGRGLFIAHTLATSVSVTHIRGDGTKISIGLPVWRRDGLR